MFIYKNKKKIYNNTINKYFYEIEICYFTKKPIENNLIKYKNININSNILLYIKKNKIIILDKLYINKYSNNYEYKKMFYLYKYITKYNGNYIKDKKTLKKDIYIFLDLPIYVLYDIYNIYNENILVSNKLENINCSFSKNIEYKIFNKNIKNINMDNIKFEEKDDEVIIIKYKINYNKIIDIYIYYNKKYITFNYDYLYINENDLSSIYKLLNLKNKKILEKNINIELITEKNINIGILYYIIKKDENLKNIFILKEFNNISLYKGFLNVYLKFYNINVNIHVLSNSLNTKFIVYDISKNSLINSISCIVNNLINLYINYDKSNINCFLDIVNNNINKSENKRIKNLRSLNPSLFVSGYTKYALVFFKIINKNNIPDDIKEKLINENRLIIYRGYYYLADEGTKIKLKKNNKLPNKDEYKYIITTCKNNHKIEYNHNKYSNRVHKYKYTVLTENILSNINPLFTKYFNIKGNNFCRIGIKECIDSMIYCISKATNINFCNKYNLYSYFYNINIITCKYIEKEIIDFHIEEIDINKKYIIVFNYNDLEGLNIKFPHNELLLYKNMFLLNKNNILVDKIKKKYKESTIIKIENIISKYIGNSCVLIKIKMNPDIWISYKQFNNLNNCILEHKIKENELITFENLKRKQNIEYYDIRNNYIYGCWIYYNNILIYIIVKIEIININEISKEKILYFKGINRNIKDNKINIYDYYDYFIHDIILLLLREYIKSNKDINDFINKYLIEYQYKNYIKDIVINTKIIGCENIIEYYYEKLPYIFDENKKIKVNKILYNNIIDFISNISINNYKPLFYTVNININSDKKTIYNKEEYEMWLKKNKKLNF